MSIEAMKQALEALNEVNWQWAGPMRVMDEVEDAITALRQAIEQAEKQDPVADRDAFERHWKKVRGDKKSDRELKRHPLQPQTYVQDSANRHWVTWQAATRKAAPQPRQPDQAQKQEPVAVVTLPPVQFEKVAEGVEVGYDFLGGVDIRLGGEFVYVHINYDYRYTHNAARKHLADQIVGLLTSPPPRQPEQAQKQDVEQSSIESKVSFDQPVTCQHERFWGNNISPIRECMDCGAKGRFMFVSDESVLPPRQPLTDEQCEYCKRGLRTMCLCGIKVEA